MSSAWRIFRYLWASPTTCLGLAFLPMIRVTGGGYNIVGGVLELHGGAAEFFLRRFTLVPGGASAMTLGHVVLGRDLDALEWSRDHERVHVRQAERWGPLFLPAYGVASLVAWMNGESAYRGNRFEREAYGN